MTLLWHLCFFFCCLFSTIIAPVNGRFRSLCGDLKNGCLLQFPGGTPREQRIRNSVKVVSVSCLFSKIIQVALGHLSEVFFVNKRKTRGAPIHGRFFPDAIGPPSRSRPG